MISEIYLINTFVCAGSEKTISLPSATCCGLNPALICGGDPHSELIITLCRGWYQKS